MVVPQQNPSVFGIIHDMPYDEDCRNLTHLSGPEGRLFWPLLARLTGLTRRNVYVTSVFLEPVPKVTDELIAAELPRLRQELEAMGVAHVLTLGATAGKAMLKDRWSKIEVHNGLTYLTDGLMVTPTWHPATVLRPAETSKDPMAWLGAGICRWPLGNRIYAPDPIEVPPYVVGNTIPSKASEIAIDTEGLPGQMEAITWATDTQRYMVDNVQLFISELQEFQRRGGLVWFHNAPWDWQVLTPLHPYIYYSLFGDTMELAYLMQTEPQGLKDLAERHLGLKMKSWEDVVLPHWETMVRSASDSIIELGTTVTTHSPKTGKPYKVPKYERTDLAKQLHKVKSVKRLAELIDAPAPSFACVPVHEFWDYATLDPYATLKVARALSV